MRSSLYRGLYKQAYEVLKASLILFSSSSTKEATLTKITQLQKLWKTMEGNGKFPENDDASSTLLLWIGSFKFAMERFPSPKEVGDNVMLMNMSKTTEYSNERPVFHQLREINRASLLCSLITGAELTDKDFGIICSCDCLTRDGDSLASPKDRFNFSFCNSLRKLKQDKDVPNMTQDDLFAQFQKDLYHAGNRLPGRTSATLYASTLDTIMRITDDEYFKGITNLELIQLLFNQLYLSKDKGFLWHAIEAVLDFNLKRAGSSQSQAEGNDLKRRKTIASEEGNATVDMSNYGIETMENSANIKEVIELDSDSGGSAANSSESAPQKVPKKESPQGVTSTTAVTPYNPPPNNVQQQQSPIVHQPLPSHQVVYQQHPQHPQHHLHHMYYGGRPYGGSNHMVQGPNFQSQFYIPTPQQAVQGPQFHGGRPMTPQSPTPGTPQQQQVVQVRVPPHQQSPQASSPTIAGPVSQSTPQGSPAAVSRQVQSQQQQQQPTRQPVQPNSAPPQQQQQVPKAAQPVSPSLPQNSSSSAPPQPQQPVRKSSSPSLPTNSIQKQLDRDLSSSKPAPDAQKPQTPQQQQQQQQQMRPAQPQTQKNLLPGQSTLSQSQESKPATTSATATNSPAQPRPPHKTVTSKPHSAPKKQTVASKPPSSDPQPARPISNPSTSSAYTPVAVSTNTASRSEALPSALSTRPIQSATTSNQTQSSSYVPPQKPQNFRSSSTGANDSTSSKPDEHRRPSDSLSMSQPADATSSPDPGNRPTKKKAAGVTDFYGTQSKTPSSSPSSSSRFPPVNKRPSNDEYKALEHAAGLGANRTSSTTTNYVQNLQRASSTTTNRPPAKKLESSKTYF